MRVAPLALLLVATSLFPAAAQPVTPPAASPSPAAGPTAVADFARARLDAMLRGGKANPEWFGDSFLTKIPVTRVDALVAQIKANLGEYRSIDGKQGDYTALFARGVDELLVHFDADGKIDLLFFKPAVPRRS